MIDWLSSARIAENRPKYSHREAERFVRHFYGIESRASSLPSDRDQNFQVDASDGRRFVVKVVSAVSSSERLAFELSILTRLSGALADVRAPEVVRTTEGELTFETDESFRGYLVTWLDGKPLGDATPHTIPLLRHLGQMTARLDAVLAGMEKDAALISSPWDLMQAHNVIDSFIQEIGDRDRREIIRHFRREFEDRCMPHLWDLPHQVIHGDLNDYNILVRVAPNGLELSGVLDVGDAHRSARIVDPVITATYAAVHWADPVGAAATVAGGYHEKLPFTADELRVFMPLVAIRLCASVCISAYRQKEEPEDEYITISQEGAWRTLERLRTESLNLAHYRLRAACGLDPCPQSNEVVDWIEANAHAFAPVCAHELSDCDLLALDLGVSSPEPYVLADEPVATREIRRAIEDAGVDVAVGRYDEVRLVYDNALFEGQTLNGPVQRTVHIGADVFLDPGAEIHVPLDGVIHGFADNSEDLSYGPTIVIRHEPEDCPTFFTLYGHLHRQDLEALEVGQHVRRGECIGHIGDSSENGGWTPHLHFQIIVDMLDRQSDFPGVCAFQDRATSTSLCPSPYHMLRLPDLDDPDGRHDPDRLLADRAQLLGPSLSVSYDEPLLILRGRGAYMYDHGGRQYLDCVNNVNHVGHSHPVVARAVAEQMGVLTTNTRYLHPTILAYARKLTATLPDSLSVCYFVNSGSEANDLALRLARAHTGNEVIVVLDAAYHGHLTSLIEVSPYKFAGPGGKGPGRGVLVAPLPDVYRGLFRDESAAHSYAESVRDLLAAAADQGGAAAFISESLLSCGGQIELPAGYLAEVYASVRSAGAVCIADEVQVGFGRVGTHFWGFQTQDVVPDIVTMGKPIGNGHPLAAVVTTPEIAASFNAGMEYFNTFGGNPVSCAAGLAVLDMVEKEGLQAQAAEVGAYLKSGLADLQDRFALIGDVRGRGLFLGVELVTNREKRTPAGRHADYVINRARSLGVLLSTDGPDHNVLKIKPPLVFSRSDADRLLEILERILKEDPAQP